MEIRRTPIEEPSAWRGPDLARGDAWIERLTAGDVAELESAAATAIATGAPVTSIGRESFRLGALAQRIDGWAAQINSGRGFVLVRGLPVERYDDLQVRTMFWGIGLHLGSAVSQNGYGELLADVYDEGVKMGKGVRGYRTNDRHLFHTDRCDIVGLLCLRKAKSGGISKLASSMAVYNELLRQHPEYLEPLYQGYYYMNVEEGGDSATWRVPIYSVTDGVLSCRSSRNTIETARRLGVVSYSQLETDALALFDSLTEGDLLRLDMDLQRGDMQFINNYTTLHARTSYEDHADPARKRLMVRMWLKANGVRRPVAPHFREYDGVPQTATRPQPGIRAA